MPLKIFVVRFVVRLAAKSIQMTMLIFVSGSICGQICGQGGTGASMMPSRGLFADYTDLRKDYSQNSHFNIKKIGFVN